MRDVNDEFSAGHSALLLEGDYAGGHFEPKGNEAKVLVHLGLVAHPHRLDLTLQIQGNAQVITERPSAVLLELPDRPNPAYAPEMRIINQSSVSTAAMWKVSETLATDSKKRSRTRYPIRTSQTPTIAAVTKGLNRVLERVKKEDIYFFLIAKRCLSVSKSCSLFLNTALACAFGESRSHKDFQGGLSSYHV